MVDQVRLAMLLQQAIQAKATELGGRYTYRELAEASRTDLSYAPKVIKGTRHPTRSVLRAWSKALHPYFPLDEALVAAGYTPEDQSKRSIVQHIAALNAEAVDEIKQYIARRHLPPSSEQEADHDPGE